MKNCFTMGEGRLLKLLGLIFLSIFIYSGSALAKDNINILREQILDMNKQMQAMQDKLDQLESKRIEKDEEIIELDDRLSQAELHTATDKLSLGFELRTQASSLRYSDVSRAPQWLMDGFFGEYNAAGWTQLSGMMDSLSPDALQAMMSPEAIQGMVMPLIGGFNGAPKSVVNQMFGIMSGIYMPVDKYTADNDVIYTNRFRLNLKAKVNDQLSFTSRLAMYKVFGDSSGVKFNTGTFGDITLDGNTTALPHGDAVHVERAYFNYRNQIGSIPINLSLGRRPATEGSPLEFGNNSLVGGSPVATIINWQFDGFSFNLDLEDLTGIPGAAFKLCYGVGFESDWGNSFSLNGQHNVDDVNFGGFISTLYDDDTTSLTMNYAHAWDLTDGFTGTMLMPFIPFLESDGTYSFTVNRGAWISRMEAVTNIGDMDMVTLLGKTAIPISIGDIGLFFAPSMSRTNPKKVSDNPFYNLLGSSVLSSNGVLESHDGYSIYAGAVIPMPYDGTLGLEYNWGSKYWINMTGAEDSLVASKLATRGNVYEAYYIQPIVDDNFFVKLGGQYYDYEYTGSGNPMGAPVKIDELSALDALFPVIDKVWNIYLSATIRY